MAHPGMAGPSVGGVRLKRTRYIRRYFLTVPRFVVREPGIYEVKMKVSQVIIVKIAEVPPRRDGLKMKEPAGEIERGRVDGDEG